jgi:hypothetical protein
LAVLRQQSHLTPAHCVEQINVHRSVDKTGISFNLFY